MNRATLTRLNRLRRAHLLAAIVSIVAPACAAHEPIAPAASPVPPASIPAPTPAPVVTRATAEAPAAALEIGWTHDLREQPKAARKRNSDALKLHRKGDYAGSLAGFDAAIAIAPDYALARFNRACALSRLGRTAEAAEVMAQLLRVDLPAFASRLDLDEDLAALRAAPEAAGLARLRAELTSAYAAAVARGMPALLYSTHVVVGDANVAELPFDHRAGVWLADTGRFVPVTPEVEASLGLVWSSDTATVTVLHGPIASMYHQFYPGRLTVDVYSLTAPGTKIRSTPGVELGFRKRFPKQYAAEDAEFDLRLQSIGVRPLPDGTQIESVPHAGPGKRLRLELGDADMSVAAAPREGSWRHDIRLREGNVITGMPAGYALKRSALTVPGRSESIALGKLKQWTQIVTNPDASVAFVLTVDAGCAGQGHRLLRLDLKTLELRELSTGGQAGTMLAGLDGALYLQLGAATSRTTPDGRVFAQPGATIHRLAPDGTLGDAGLPAWLKLAYPIEESDCYM
jgi:hypothetical protein